MVEIKAETRKWGNSIGIILPKEIVRREKIRPKQKVTLLLVKRTNVLKKTFGSFKGWRINTQKALDKLDREENA